uniref:Uncharacterized protein n=1 Tax=Paramormyrops kingsleyae TaxID=1676925 RepID=A0A3B3T1F5_9TELE
PDTFSKILKCATIGKSPLALNTVIGLVLLGLEKMTELEFQCPCNPYRNAWFSSAFFVIPAMMSIIMMLIANNFRCASGKCLEQCGKLMSCVTPAVVWLTLLFFDGKYYTCAATSWEGEYVNVYSGAPLKWCRWQIHASSSPHSCMAAAGLPPPNML